MREIDMDAFRDFAVKHVYWYGKEWESVDFNSVLQTILAKKLPSVETLVREQFGVTDDDFRDALKTTPPGLFWGVACEEKWDALNRRFGIDPPLPFPRRDLAKEREELARLKTMDREETRVATKR